MSAVGRTNLYEEVYREIFQYLDPSNSPKDHKNLLHLALANNALSNLALDALWRERGSLFAVLRLLPIVQILNGSLCPEDWVKLLKYSRRIKSFKFRSATLDNRRIIHSSAYARLLAGGNVLFPSLRDIDVSLSHVDHLALPLLWSSSVKQLVIGGEYKDRHLHSYGSFVAGLAEHAMDLEILSTDFELPLTYWSGILSLKHLRKLKIKHNAISSVIPLVILLESLTDLDISTEEFLFQPFDACFPRLELLTITSSLSFITSFLTVVDTRRILDLTLKVWSHLPWTSRFCALSRCFPSSPDDAPLLRTLSITAVPGTLHDGCVSLEALGYFTHLPALKKLVLVGFPQLEITASDAESLGKLWPNLTTLYIPSSRSLAFPILSSIAVSFPLLEELTINLKGVRILSPPISLNHPLNRLTLYGSDPRGIEAFDLLLAHQLFPKVEKIHYTDGDALNWERVNNGLRALRIATGKA